MYLFACPLHKEVRGQGLLQSSKDSASHCKAPWVDLMRTLMKTWTWSELFRYINKMLEYDSYFKTAAFGASLLLLTVKVLVMTIKMKMHMKTHCCFPLYTSVYITVRTGWLLHCLTILSHQTMGHVGDCFHYAPQEVEGGQEALQTELVTQLDRKSTKCKLIIIDIQQYTTGTCLDWHGSGTYSQCKASQPIGT